MSIITDEMDEELLEIAEEAAMNVADMDVPLRAYLRAALAAVAPLIAKAEREACAKWHDDAAHEEALAAGAVERVGDREGEWLHRCLAAEHRMSAAAIRARSTEDTTP